MEDINVTSIDTLITWRAFTNNGSTTVSPTLASTATNWTLLTLAANYTLNVNLKLISISCLLIMLILVTVVGNIFVILAIMREKQLKTIGNYLICSLAITDLLVACIVMPIGTIYEVTGEWNLGSILCDIWLCADVLCCTASILHLVAIAFDRYFAVTNVDYIHHRNKRQIGFMIFLIWVISSLISLPPMVGWKDPGFEDRINNKVCLYSQNIFYQIFATFFSFYGPVILVLYLYFRIYQEAKKRIRRKNRHSNLLCRFRTNIQASFATNQEVTIGITTTQGDSGNDNSSERSHSVPRSYSDNSLTVEKLRTLDSHKFLLNRASTTNITTVNSLSNPNDSVQIFVIPPPLEPDDPPSPVLSSDLQPRVNAFVTEKAEAETNKEFGVKATHKLRGLIFWRGLRQRLNPKFLTTTVADSSESATNPATIDNSIGQIQQQQQQQQQQHDSGREKKAAKILMIITGVFVISWLPFFVAALLMPVLQIDPFVFSVCVWLGWANSTLNPIIYTIFSPEFRRAFRKMLRCK